MGLNISILILIFVVISWRARDLKEISKDDNIEAKDLLIYLRGFELRLIILFIAIFIMFMGLG